MTIDSERREGLRIIFTMPRTENRNTGMMAKSPRAGEKRSAIKGFNFGSEIPKNPWAPCSTNSFVTRFAYERENGDPKQCKFYSSCSIQFTLF